MSAPLSPESIAAAPRASGPDFSPLVRLELGLDPAPSATDPRRHAQGFSAPTSDGAKLSWEQSPPADLFGLALSGGGIRSATFNLGLLQSLDEAGVLRTLDYVSTVSGGGYAGGFWSAWRTRGVKHYPDELFPGADDGPLVERREIRHLREFSNFLSPRLGILAYDTGRMFVAALSATLPALFAALALLFLVMRVWLGLAHEIVGLPADHSAAGMVRSELALLAISAAVFIGTEWGWKRRGELWTWWYVPAALVGLVSATGLWTLWLSLRLPLAALFQSLLSGTSSLPSLDPGDPVTDWLSLLLPSTMWLGAALVIVFLRWTFSRLARDPEWRTARGAFDRVTSRLLFMAAAWAVLALIWIAGTALWSWWTSRADGSEGLGLTGLAGTTAAFGFAFRTIQKLLAKRPNATAGGKTTAWLKPLLPQLLAYLTVGGMMVMVVAIIVWAASAAWTVRWLPLDSLSMSVVAALAVTLLTLLLFDPNEVGLHSFYRARIARAFLGASSAEAPRRTEESKHDDLPLDTLTAERPLHLVCCAANDLSSSDHLANLHRGAVSAALSRVGFSVGCDWTAWPSNHRAPTLASVVTASGAAFNSHMGSISMALGPAVTFLMTAFNLRLGLWLPHPTRYAARIHRVFPGLPFYYELLGLSRANSGHVLLSDGGHFENMALYELVRRHCRFIIASDCGADPEVAFDDLGNVVRRVREDFGVEIEIDLSPLKPGDNGLARQHMVAGDIHYPNGDVGVLLLFKPTLVGNEPADVAQYRRRNENFPHETTGDQFYDEAQWESYRRLGAHAAGMALRACIEHVRDLDDAIDRAERRHATLSDSQQLAEIRRWGARLFARARMQWLPIPTAIESRLDRIVSRASELDSLLQTAACAGVLRQVYKEIDELDRLAHGRAGALGGDGAGRGEVPRVVPPRTEDLAPSLHLVRRSLLFMEEIHLTEDLDRNYNHPLYLGVMNYFARWAYAPLFRMWWPLLKSLYAPRFTTFLERQFHLKSTGAAGAGDERVITDLTHAPEGFAMHCWRIQDGPEPRADRNETLVSYGLRMAYGGEIPYYIQAAQVLVRRVDDAIVWSAPHFFVPPGLWGIGIGEDFLDRLVAGESSVFAAGAPLEGIEHLVVRIPVPRSSSGAVRKEGADLTQMYRAAGFREAFPYARDPGSHGAIEAHPGDPIRVGALDFDDGFDSRWLVRCVDARCPLWGDGARMRTPAFTIIAAVRAAP